MTLKDIKIKTLFLSLDIFGYPCLTLKLNNTYDTYIIFNFRYDDIVYTYNGKAQRILI